MSFKWKFSLIFVLLSAFTLHHAQGVALQGNEFSIDSIAYSPDSRYIITTTAQDIQVWDANTKQNVHTFADDDHLTTASDYSADGRYIAEGSFNEVRIWDLTTRQKVRTLVRHDAHDFVESLAYNFDGRYIAVVYRDHTIVIWSAHSGEEVNRFSLDASIPISTPIITYSPNGTNLALIDSSWSQLILVLQVSTGEEVFRIEDDDALLTEVAYSPDGRYITSGDGFGVITIWNARTGQEIRSFDVHSDDIETMDYSSDGRYLATGSQDNTVKIIDVTDGDVLDSFDVEVVTSGDGMISLTSIDLVYSPDGKSIAVGLGNGESFVFDIQ